MLSDSEDPEEAEAFMRFRATCRQVTERERAILEADLRAEAEASEYCESSHRKTLSNTQPAVTACSEFSNRKTLSNSLSSATACSESSNRTFSKSLPATTACSESDSDSSTVMSYKGLDLSSNVTSRFQSKRKVSKAMRLLHKDKDFVSSRKVTNQSRIKSSETVSAAVQTDITVPAVESKSLSDLFATSDSNNNNPDCDNLVVSSDYDYNSSSDESVKLMCAQLSKRTKNKNTDKLDDVSSTSNKKRISKNTKEILDDVNPSLSIRKKRRSRVRVISSSSSSSSSSNDDRVTVIGRNEPDRLYSSASIESGDLQVTRNSSDDKGSDCEMIQSDKVKVTRSGNVDKQCSSSRINSDDLRVLRSNSVDQRSDSEKIEVDKVKVTRSNSVDRQSDCERINSDTLIESEQQNLSQTVQSVIESLMDSSSSTILYNSDIEPETTTQLSTSVKSSVIDCTSEHKNKLLITSQTDLTPVSTASDTTQKTLNLSVISYRSRIAAPVTVGTHDSVSVKSPATSSHSTYTTGKHTNDLLTTSQTDLQPSATKSQDVQQSEKLLATSLKSLNAPPGTRHASASRLTLRTSGKGLVDRECLGVGPKVESIGHDRDSLQSKGGKNSEKMTTLTRGVVYKDESDDGMRESVMTGLVKQKHLVRECRVVMRGRIDDLYDLSTGSLLLLPDVVTSDSETREQEQEQGVRIENKKKQRYRCKRCDYTTQYKQHIESHVKAVHKKRKPCSCRHCDYRSSEKSTLKQHVRRIHYREKPYKCSVCKKCFDTRAHRDGHYSAVHAGEREHRCEECGAGFSEKSSLTRHVQSVHLEIKNFYCEDCDYECYTKTLLESHMKAKHQKEKNFTCKVCEKKFAHKSSLKTHMESAHEKKSYKCNKCGKYFSRLSGLKKHSNAVHTRKDVYVFDALGCKQIFFCKQYLTRHKSNHHRLLQSTSSVACKTELGLSSSTSQTLSSGDEMEVKI